MGMESMNEMEAEVSGGSHVDNQNLEKLQQ